MEDVFGRNAELVFVHYKKLIVRAFEIGLTESKISGLIQIYFCSSRKSSRPTISRTRKSEPATTKSIMNGYRGRTWSHKVRKIDFD